MKLAATWPNVRARVAERSPGREDGLRRVATRLTAQTVVLVLVLLIVLEGVVYVITKQALLGSLQVTLQTRAGQADPAVCHAFHLTCGQSGPSGAFGGGGQPPGPGGGGGLQGPFEGHIFAPTTGPSDASAIYVDRRLKLIHADGALGSVLLVRSDARQAIQSGQEQCCTVHTYKRQDYLIYTAPLQADGKIVGAVQTSISEHQYEQTMSLLLGALLVVALLGLLGAGGVSIVLVRRALLPIRLASQRQRDFVADAAHELRTPLAIQRTVAEVGTSDPSLDELQATVEQMLSENQHLTRLVEDLSLLARGDTDALAIDRRPVDLSSLLSQTAEEIRYLAEERGIALDADVQGKVTVVGDVLRLRQLFLILLDNALKHTRAGGTVQVRLGVESARARLEILDSGPGIDPADLPRIFDRFYRADQARTGEGTGLGLAIAKWIVEAHGGQIHAGNVLPHGAVFTLTLPMSRAAVHG